jgi:hypothetical protein
MIALNWQQSIRRTQSLMTKACSGPVRRSALAALMVSMASLAHATEATSTAVRASHPSAGAKAITKHPGQSCEVRDKRLCAVLDMVQQTASMRQILWSEGTASSPSIAAEYEWALGPADMIHLGQTSDLTDNELVFLVAHELGHSALRHGRATVEFFAGEDRGLPDEELVRRYATRAIDNLHRASLLRHQQEYAADQFAARVMLLNGFDPVMAMQSLLKGSFSTSLHPSKRDRIQRVSMFASLWSQTLANAERPERPTPK